MQTNASVNLFIEFTWVCEIASMDSHLRGIIYNSLLMGLNSEIFGQRNNLKDNRRTKLHNSPIGVGNDENKAEVQLILCSCGFYEHPRCVNN